jgi:hypothetical protein
MSNAAALKKSSQPSRTSFFLSSKSGGEIRTEEIERGRKHAI